MGGFAPTGSGLLEAILRRRGLGESNLPPDFGPVNLPPPNAPPMLGGMNAPLPPMNAGQLGNEQGWLGNSPTSLVTDMVRAGGNPEIARPLPPSPPMNVPPMTPPMNAPTMGLPTNAPMRGRMGASRRPKRRQPAPSTNAGTRGPMSMY